MAGNVSHKLSQRRCHRPWYKSGETFALGETRIVKVEPTLFVANMIGQRDIYRKKRSSPESLPPIRYEAVHSCLAQLTTEAKKRKASVHMPRIGCGLAGGKWEQIEPLIMQTLIAENVPVFVYDFD